MKNFLIESALNGVIDSVKKADYNKNGVADVQEVKQFCDKLRPVLIDLSDAIDFVKLAAILAPAAKSKPKLEAGIKALGELLEQGGKLFPGKAIEEAISKVVK